MISRQGRIKKKFNSISRNFVHPKILQRVMRLTKGETGYLQHKQRRLSRVHTNVQSRKSKLHNRKMGERPERQP